MRTDRLWRERGHELGAFVRRDGLSKGLQLGELAALLKLLPGVLAGGLQAASSSKVRNGVAVLAEPQQRGAPAVVRASKRPVERDGAPGVCDGEAKVLHANVRECAVAEQRGCGEEVDGARVLVGGGGVAAVREERVALLSQRLYLRWLVCDHRGRGFRGCLCGADGGGW